MKLLILSDSHRKMEYMRLAMRLEQPDTVFHLGDHDTDAAQLREEFPNLPIYSIRGNCDRLLPIGVDTLSYTIAGVRIFAAHGHQYDVKSGLLRFCMAAAEQNAQLALFGHTHNPYCEMYNGIWLLNPGACGGYRPSYGIVHIKNGEISCQIQYFSEERP